MNLSLHLTADEFTRSNTATRLGIDNDLPIELLPNAQATADMLERIRAYLSSQAAKTVPILVSSGYRCRALNDAIKSTGKDHPQARAIDFTAPAFGTPFEVCQALAPCMDALGLGQLIFEHTWVHCSTRTPDKFINRILTVRGKEYVAGIVKD